MVFLSKLFVTLVLVGLISYTTIYLGLIYIGNFLTPSDQLQKSDVIVVFSGTTTRTDWGIKLYRDGWAQKILFSGAALDKSGPSNARVMRSQALQEGVPDQDILMDETSINTFQNAVNSKKIIDQMQAKSIILVTSPYHQRRAYESLKQVYADTTVVILNSPSGYSNWRAANWWQQADSASIAISEFLKILWAKITGEYS